MLLPEQVVVYGDCAINPDPTAEQLAEIAYNLPNLPKRLVSAQSCHDWLLDRSSGEGADVDKVRQATEIAKAKAAEMGMAGLLIDGPLQWDAASVASVAKSKAPNSPVAGQANVFIFPRFEHWQYHL